MDDVPFKLYEAMLREADKELKRHYAWLCRREHVLQLLASAAESRGGLTGASLRSAKEWCREVMSHLMRWSAEVAWFTVEDCGTVTFEHVCDAAKADVEAARDSRRRYFELPVPARAVYLGARRMGARERRRRGRPPKAGQAA